MSRTLKVTIGDIVPQNVQELMLTQAVKRPKRDAKGKFVKKTIFFPTCKTLRHVVL